MPGYAIEFVKSARKEFEKLSTIMRGKAVEALELLALNPYSDLLKVKKLRDSNDIYRIRIGDYRIIYELRQQQLVVLVIKVGHRREIYRR